MTWNVIWQKMAKIAKNLSKVAKRWQKLSKVAKSMKQVNKTGYKMQKVVRGEHDEMMTCCLDDVMKWWNYDMMTHILSMYTGLNAPNFETTTQWWVKRTIVAVSFFDTSFFRWRTIHLWRPTTPSLKHPRSINYRFSESSEGQLSHDPILDISSLSKFQGVSVFWRKKHWSSLNRLSPMALHVPGLKTGEREGIGKFIVQKLN